MYFIASELGMSLAGIEAMPAEEYFGWIEFYRKRAEEQQREEKSASGNLLAGSKSNLIKGLTGG